MEGYFKNLVVNKIAASILISCRIRRKIYNLFGINVGKASISPRCFIGGNKIKIGDDSFINYNCFFDNSGKIIIGNNVFVGMEVLLCTSTHEAGNSQKRAGNAIGKGITIGDGCWIGARTTILPGVHIENGCIIGAGSIVNKNCEPNCLYAGNPAKKIKELH